MQRSTWIGLSLTALAISSGANDSLIFRHSWKGNVRAPELVPSEMSCLSLAQSLKVV